MARKSYVFTSESVSEGHPDKLCDRVSDAVLDAFLTAEPLARAACDAGCTVLLSDAGGLVLEERGVLRAHQVVRIADVGEGEITSGSFSPTLSKSIALARVPMATADRAEVEIRGKWYPVRVVKPTFVRHGKTLI